MKRIGLMGTVLAAMVFSTMALAFDAYFSDAAGNKIGKVQEGQQIYIAVKDLEKGECRIAEFQADLMIFDFKTGAYIYAYDVTFRELGGIGSGLYFWVRQPNSNVKVTVQVGSRFDFTVIPEGMTHVLGGVSPFVSGVGIASTDWWNPAIYGWAEGDWEYVDYDLNPWVLTFDEYPQERDTDRWPLSSAQPFVYGSAGWEDIRGGNYMAGNIYGRFENMDTLVLILRDRTDVRNINQDQVKIIDTVGKIAVTPAVVAYGRVPAGVNTVVTIDDKDENLNCNEIEYVPFFVIINPGSWNPVQSAPVTNFCNLMLTGGNHDEGPYNEPIRWYNIYEPERYIDYGNAAWWNPAWAGGTTTLLTAVFFAAETAVNSGVFELNFGNLEDFQEALGLDGDDRLPAGTTIAFYYIDPNDFDDMDLAVVRVIYRENVYSQVVITDANGIPISEVKLGAGWGGLYIRLYDGDANVEACCQDKVVVHICDPHNEDDSEYYVIDEISNNSGVFFSMSGIPLLPVWDAVGGYQLVFDDWKIQAFNEDTIFVRYNSVDYNQEWLNYLGDGNANDEFFPPAIRDGMYWYDEEMDRAARNQYWDVSFAKVKVYDFQVFDGVTHHMRFLDGNYRPVTEIALSGNLYLEVTDLDQNEHPMLRELVFGRWNKDQYALDPNDCTDSMPIWSDYEYTSWGTGLFNMRYPPDDPFRADEPVLNDDSISGIPASVKVFMFNLQRGTWERMDLRETAVGSGVFRSTTCVLVADARNPGEGNLGSSPGDTIMAFYQDPSNHSDISIISIKVSEGGVGGIIPPVVALKVEFDRTTYYPGDRVTITVTDEQYAGAAEIVGTNVLVLLDKDGGTITSWNRLEAVAGLPGRFQVRYDLPETVKLGKITARYTDPYLPTRVAQGEATVVAKALANVTGITVSPNPFRTSTTFTIQAEPAGAVAEAITITIYDLTGAKVDVIEGRNTASVTWTGGRLRNGAYIYVAVVGGAGKSWTVKDVPGLRGFVYIER